MLGTDNESKLSSAGEVQKLRTENILWTTTGKNNEYTPLYMGVTYISLWVSFRSDSDVPTQHVYGRFQRRKYKTRVPAARMDKRMNLKQRVKLL